MLGESSAVDTEPGDGINMLTANDQSALSNCLYFSVLLRVGSGVKSRRGQDYKKEPAKEKNVNVKLDYKVIGIQVGRH